MRAGEREIEVERVSKGERGREGGSERERERTGVVGLKWLSKWAEVVK